MKYLIGLLFLVIFYTAKAQIRSTDLEPFPIKHNLTECPAFIIDSVVNFGKELIGLPYRYGGSSLKGFDCSGFIRYIFQKYGYSFPHSSMAYAKIGTKIKRDSILSVKKGDLLLFKGRNIKSKRIGHIALVVEINDNEILMLHSCCDKGIAIENYLTSAYYPKRLVEIRRL
jgi:cell wall-associated NlpC family hydrolase